MSVIGFLALIFSVWALEYISIESVVSIFYCSLLFGIVIDVVHGKSNYSGTSCLWCLATLLGVLFILRPPFVFGDWGESHQLGHWVVTQTPPEESVEPEI